MKVLVTGVAGQLGHDVMNELAKRGYEGVGSKAIMESRTVHRLYLCHMCRWTLQIKHL